MGVVTGGGGGGGPAFNGGTITLPLTLDSTGHPAAQPLQVSGDPAQSVALAVFNGQGTGGVVIDNNAAVSLNQGAVGDSPLSVQSVSGSTADLISVFQGFSPFATLFSVNKSGTPVLGVHSAPADGDLSAGQCALWFDQTNGAAKLMVKAKQADGTVRTGSLALT